MKSRGFPIGQLERAKLLRYALYRHVHLVGNQRTRNSGKGPDTIKGPFQYVCQPVKQIVIMMLIYAGKYVLGELLKRS